MSRPAPSERPEDAPGWSEHLITAHAARRWIAVGVTSPSVARRWISAGIDPEDVPAWEAAGISGSEAIRWRHLGIPAVEDIPAGFTSPHDYEFVVAYRLPRTADWGALRGRTSAEIAVLGAEHRQSAAGVRALSGALARLALDDLGGLPRVPDLDMDEVQFAFAFERAVAEDLFSQVWTVVDLNWADVAACVVAGMDLPEAKEHVASGADMEPVRLLAALAT